MNKLNEWIVNIGCWIGVLCGFGVGVIGFIDIGYFTERGASLTVGGGLVAACSMIPLAIMVRKDG